MVAPWIPLAAQWVALGAGASAQFLRNVAEIVLAIVALDKNTRPSAGLEHHHPEAVMERSMEMLLTAIVLWLSTNFGLPSTFDHPRVEFVSATKMTSLFYKGIGEEQAGMVSDPSDIVSLYNTETKTIYLADGWSGKTPAELSILVHEMVHHLQNIGQLKFACPQEREEVAYKAQDRWLGLFGTDLMRDFQMDPFTILMKSKCL
jgi:hypothetical protein